MLLIQISNHRHSYHHNVAPAVQLLFLLYEYTHHRCVLTNRKANVITNKKTMQHIRILPDDFVLVRALQESINNAFVQIHKHRHQSYRSCLFLVRHKYHYALMPIILPIHIFRKQIDNNRGRPPQFK